MKWIFASVLAFAAGPGTAWEFSPTPVCTLSNGAQGPEISVTYDPALTAPYTIALTRPEGWPAADVFSITFVGPRGLTITTRNHRIDGSTLSVSDRGFGNVLKGLEFNTTATAVLGSVVTQSPLAGAATAVQAFRECTKAGLV